MKKVVVLVVCLLALAVGSSLIVPMHLKNAVAPLQKSVNEPKLTEVEGNLETDVQPVAAQELKVAKEEIDCTEVLSSRFLNMLANNYVYDHEFESVESIVNESILAILEMRDPVDDSFISEEYVKEFVKDMYGIEILTFNGINEDLPKKEGYVMILGRCYITLEHEMVSITENEDGTYTVITHVAEKNTETMYVPEHYVNTLFVPNEESVFGFNIVYSQRIENSVNA